MDKSRCVGDLRGLWTATVVLARKKTRNDGLEAASRRLGRNHRSCLSQSGSMRLEAWANKPITRRSGYKGSNPARARRMSLGMFFGVRLASPAGKCRLVTSHDAAVGGQRPWFRLVVLMRTETLHLQE